MSQKQKFSFASSLRYEWKTLARKIRLTASEEDDKEESDEEPELQEKGKPVDLGQEKEETWVQEKGPRKFRRRKKLRSKTQEKVQDKDETRVQKKSPREFRRRKKLKSRTQEKRYKWKTLARKIRLTAPEEDVKEDSDEEPELQEKGKPVDPGSFSAGTSASFPHMFEPPTGASAFSADASQPASGVGSFNIGTGGGARRRREHRFRTRQPLERSYLEIEPKETSSFGGNTQNTANSSLFSADVQVFGDLGTTGTRWPGFRWFAANTSTSVSGAFMQNQIGGLFGAKPAMPAFYKTPDTKFFDFTGSGIFQTKPAQPAPPQPGGAFGQASTPGTAYVKYSPWKGTDVVVQGGYSRDINVKIQCITSMKEYENKSLEELRLEDYTAGRKGTPSEGGFATQTQEARSSNSGSSGAFGQASAPGTSYVKYSPVKGTDVVRIGMGGNSRDINVKIHCITSMKEYENKSLEELRLEDYTAGRKGTPSEGGFATQTQEARSSNSGSTPRTIDTINLPPLTFHSVHGENIRVSSDGTTVSRVQGPSGSIAFSARPVQVHEKVCLRFVEKPMLDDFIRFGFTSHDPATLAQHEWLDLAFEPGNWAYVVPARYEKGNIYFNVNSAGDVHISIDGEDGEFFFTGVDTKKPFWALVVVYGNVTAVKFVDPRAPNQVTRQNPSPVDEDRLEGSLSTLSVNEPLPPPRYAIPLVPLSLHRTKGRNIQLVNERGVAARVHEETGQSYVFTARPMSPQQAIVVQILSTESGRDAGILSFGLTSCDPASLSPCDFPADLELLLDRPEYWVVRRDAANGLRRGDELAVTLTMDGEVRVSRNGSTPVTVMHVDHTVSLWAFFDICGATQQVRMLTTEDVTSPLQQFRVLTGAVAPLAPIRASSQPSLAGQQPAQCSSTTQSNCNEQVRMPNHAPRLERILDRPSTSRHQPGYSDIGEAPRTSYARTPNNLPPLTFHSVHGRNVRISSDGTIARRVNNFCGGVAFSARPVMVNEKVCLRYVETTKSWIGAGIYFGFSSHDPVFLNYSLPEYPSPASNKAGIWAKYLGKIFCEKDNILHYYVNSTGDVHLSNNGEDIGLFITGVDTRNPLWALVYLSGNGTAVQFGTALVQVRRPNQSPLGEDRLVGNMRSLSVDEPLPPPRYANPLVPLSLHRTKGRDIQFVNDRGVAARVDEETGQGYVFTARPMRPRQAIVVQILSTESGRDAGILSFGLTSCDPASLSPCDFPADLDLLLDRPEYWVVRRDAAIGLRRGDELAVTLTMDGEVRASRNGSTPVTVMHVDHTVRLWAFFDICGATQQVRMLTTEGVTSPPQQLRVLTGTVAPLAPIQASSQPNLAGHQHAQCSCSCTTQNNCNEQVRMPNHEPRLERIPDGPSTSKHQPEYSDIGKGNLKETECTICCENPIDSVLYMCGHMCMCHSCAVKQWKGIGSGKCPICRAEIINVIRVYKP